MVNGLGWAESAFLVLLVAALAGCFASPPAPSDEPAQPGNAYGVFTRTAVFPGQYVLDGPGSSVLQAGALQARPDLIVNLTSALDGANIRLGIVRPDAPVGVPVPVIAIAANFRWAVDDSRVELGQVPLAEVAGRGMHAPFLLDNFVPHGYAIAFIAVRGASGSTGCYQEMSRDTAADIDQALRWLGEQDWSSGRIGMIGHSYAGGTQWLAAGFANPYLRTIVPMSAVLDRFHQFYNNGSGPSPDPFPARVNTEPPPPASPCDNVRELEARRHSFATGERDPGGYWDEINDKPRILANYTGSVLITYGLGQDLPPYVAYPWVAELEARGVVVKHVLGQWDHLMPDERSNFLFGVDPSLSPYVPYPALASTTPLAVHNPSPRADWAEILLHWYDAWLKGEDAVDLGPRVEVQDSSLQWRQGESWPPHDPVLVPFFLSAAGTLAPQPSGPPLSLPVGPDPTWSTATNQPPPAGLGCPTCQVFTTEALPKGLHFAGLPRLHLSVVPAGAGGHVTAYLYELGPEPKLLACTKMNLEFAAGGEVGVPVVANQPLAVEVEFNPADVAVHPESRLALVVSQGRWYSVCFGGLAGTDHLYGPQETYPFMLKVGAGESFLTLPTFTPEPADLFVPPLLV